jgi:hypothetical protein
MKKHRITEELDNPAMGALDTILETAQEMKGILSAVDPDDFQDWEIEVLESIAEDMEDLLESMLDDDMTEEVDFKVEVEGLPTIFMRGNSQGEIKGQLRKIMRDPKKVSDVKRVTKTDIRKTLRDMLQGKNHPETETE